MFYVFILKFDNCCTHDLLWTILQQQTPAKSAHLQFEVNDHDLGNDLSQWPWQKSWSWLKLDLLIWPAYHIINMMCNTNTDRYRW